jgi:NCS2 family nucleobase:cation symporter-2
MADTSLGTPDQLRDPNYTPALAKAVPLGIQHVLAMFVSNVTPAIIVAGAAGFGFGSNSPDFPNMIYMIQMSMLFAGIATLFQTIGFGPVGARLPIVQGTSFAFLPVMIPAVAGQGTAGLAGLMTGIIIGGLFHTFLGTFIRRLRFALPPLVTGLIAGYAVAYAMGQVNFGNVARASMFEFPSPFKWGIEFNTAIIIGMCFMAVISAIETVGDVSGICKGGAGREATDTEIQGATYADGIGTAVAGIFGGLPNTSFSQNVGLISMTGVMSRHVVTIGAIFLIICGLVPKFGAIIATVPINVLGGGVIVMFGMVCAAGVNMLSDVTWNRRNMVIFAVSLSVGLGLQLEPTALQHLPKTLQILLTSGLLPAAGLSIILNLLLPEDVE